MTTEKSAETRDLNRMAELARDAQRAFFFDDHETWARLRGEANEIADRYGITRDWLTKLGLLECYEVYGIPHYGVNPRLFAREAAPVPVIEDPEPHEEEEEDGPESDDDGED